MKRILISFLILIFFVPVYGSNEAVTVNQVCEVNSFSVDSHQSFSRKKKKKPKRKRVKKCKCPKF